MSDAWEGELLERENDWDEGEESLESELEDGFDDPDELVDDEESWEDDEDEQ